jgi:phosphoribosylformylglycinamidine synthase subunit PurQ / glutaminase
MARRVRVCVMRIEGTNREEDAKTAFEVAGADEVELVHLKQLAHAPTVPADLHRNMNDYDVLFFPGGFSAGDAVRAGAIWAARIRADLLDQLRSFIESGRPVGGVCNGFQVLLEVGALPAWSATLAEVPEAALLTNDIGRFQCRFVELKRSETTRCVWASETPLENVLVPIAHGEGKFALAPEAEADGLRRLEEQGQIVFRYVRPEGTPANGEFPYNPNGSLADIAGICNERGNVFGMMPHPENAVFPHQMPDWTRRGREPLGVTIFRSAVSYARSL